MGNKKENRCLDFLKGLACIAVVFIHIKFPGPIGKVINTYTKFAVPLFFMISGYFMYYEDREYVNARVKKKALYILKLFLISIALYTSIDIVRKVLIYNTFTLTGWIEDIFTIKNLFNLTAFNYLTFISYADHAWFLLALIYCYLIIKIINKFNIYKASYYFIPFLWAMSILIGEVLPLFNIPIEPMFYRNFLFIGMPFFLMGNMIHRYSSFFLGNKIKNYHLYIAFSTGVVINALERILKLGSEIYLGAIIITVSLFLYALKNEDRYFIKPIEMIGAKYSLYVYICHRIFIILVDDIKTFTGREGGIIINFALPIIVAMCSILLSALIVFLQDQYHKRTNKYQLVFKEGK